MIFSFFFCFRTAYRAEVATFVVPVAGEQSSDARLRERIDFTSNILFFIEDPVSYTHLTLPTTPYV